MKKLFFMLSIPLFLIVQTASPSYGGEGDCEYRKSDGSTTTIEDDDCKNVEGEKVCCIDGDTY